MPAPVRVHPYSGFITPATWRGSKKMSLFNSHPHIYVKVLIRESLYTPRNGLATGSTSNLRCHGCLRLVQTPFSRSNQRHPRTKESVLDIRYLSIPPRNQCPRLTHSGTGHRWWWQCEEIRLVEKKILKEHGAVARWNGIFGVRFIPRSAVMWSSR